MLIPAHSQNRLPNRVGLGKIPSLLAPKLQCEEKKSHHLTKFLCPSGDYITVFACPFIVNLVSQGLLPSAGDRLFSCENRDAGT